MAAVDLDVRLTEEVLGPDDGLGVLIHRGVLLVDLDGGHRVVTLDLDVLDLARGYTGHADVVGLEQAGGVLELDVQGLALGKAEQLPTIL